MNKGIWIFLGVLVAIVAVAVLALQGGYKTPVAKSPTSAGGPTQSPAATSGAVPPREIVVSGSEYSFSPGTISLTKGETAKITFKNTGSLSHNLVIGEFRTATKTIGAGQEDSITVTADKTGTYTFYCEVGNHRQQGMEGKLEIK